MKKLLREPLLHFLLIGACLFTVSGLRRGKNLVQFGSGKLPESQKIVVTPGDVESLIAGFSNLWQRPPTAEELDRLIQGRVREEVYYREALKMGLDRDDTIIRNRLQEKLEFLSQDVNTPAEPSEHDLNSFLAANPRKFQTDDEFTFRLVFVDAQRHGASTVPFALKILASLDKDNRTDPVTMGDPSPFRSEHERVTQGEVAKKFGADFAASLVDMNLKRWSGPVKSEDGVYLVYLMEKIPGQLPPLDQIRAAVRKGWLSAQRQQANEKYYQDLLRGYQVNVELPTAKAAHAEVVSPR